MPCCILRIHFFESTNRNSALSKNGVITILSRVRTHNGNDNDDDCGADRGVFLTFIYSGTALGSLVLKTNLVPTDSRIWHLQQS